jgi:hypothetical protein
MISAAGSGEPGARPMEEATGRETLIGDLLAGEFNNPVRIVSFNTVEGWSRDVTVDIAD